MLFNIIYTSFLYTNQGALEVENKGGDRIDDAIRFSEVSFKTMLGLKDNARFKRQGFGCYVPCIPSLFCQGRYSQAQCALPNNNALFPTTIRYSQQQCAIPKNNTLWQGASGNKMLGMFNTEKFR